MLRRAVVLAGLRVPLVVAVPLIVRQLFDRAIPDGRSGMIVGLGLALLAAYVVDGVVALTIRRGAARFATAAVANVRTNLAVRVYALPRSWHDAQDPGVLHAVTMNDAERLLVVLTQLTTWVVPTIVCFAALAVVAVVVAPVLAAVVGAGLLALVFPMRPMVRAIVCDGRVSADANRRLSARLRMAFRLLPASQAHGAEER